MKVGEDGKTAWKRLRGRDFGQRLIGVVGSVFYKQPPKGPQHDAKGNMSARMYPGVFLGYHHTSNTYRVATAEGNVIKVRSVLHRPMADRWCAESMESITAIPWSLRAIAAPEVIELGPSVEKPVGVRDGTVSSPRRLKITAKILEAHGTADGAPSVLIYWHFKIPNLAYNTPRSAGSGLLKPWPPPTQTRTSSNDMRVVSTEP